MHKASRLAVNFCLAHDLGRIVIGTTKLETESQPRQAKQSEFRNAAACQVY